MKNTTMNMKKLVLVSSVIALASIGTAQTPQSGIVVEPAKTDGSAPAQGAITIEVPKTSARAVNNETSSVPTLGKQSTMTTMEGSGGVSKVEIRETDSQGNQTVRKSEGPINIRPAQPVSDHFLPPDRTASTSSSIERAGVKLPVRPEQLQSRPMDLTVPSVYETTLTNGMRFYHFPSKDLPRIQFSIIIAGGKLLDPADKVGLAELTVKTLRAGGAAGKSPDDIDRDLEQIGSVLGLSADREYISGNLFSLTENREKAVGILADILLRPEFNDQKLQQQKDLMLEDLRRQNDQPADISRREFRKIIYGHDHPMARTPVAAQVTSLSREDVKKFYEDYFRPASVWIGVSGDISREDAQKLVESAFADWNRPPAQLPPMPTVDESRDATPGVYYIRKMTKQSQIRLGHLGVPRHSPEQYTIAVLNGIYGTGGFSSRLMNRVRTKRGFVYGVSGGVMSDVARGLFVAAAGSKLQTTAAAISEIIDVTKEVATGEVTEDEIETAKRDTIYSFITNFDQAAEVVTNHMVYDYQGYAEDYLQKYVERIRGVTREQVSDAAKRLMKPDKLKILVVGFDKQFDKPLSGFGSVTEVKLE